MEPFTDGSYRSIAMADQLFYYGMECRERGMWAEEANVLTEYWTRLPSNSEDARLTLALLGQCYENLNDMPRLAWIVYELRNHEATLNGDLVEKLRHYENLLPSEYDYLFR